MNEAKTAKTFRAAAARIMRQESAAPDATPPFLGAATTVTERDIASETDEWSLRLESLAAMAQWDGAVLAATRPDSLACAHNASTRLVLDTLVSGGVAEGAPTG